MNMRKILLSMFVFLAFAVQSQEKYAILIVGDYATKLSESSWTEVVTSQPEGFVVNEDGDVSITSGEGLAWLISTVNGLNGQSANDYEGLTVTLMNDVDISGND